MTQSIYSRLMRRFAPERAAVSRRELLKATLAASAGMLLSDCANSGRFSLARPGLNRRVVVIGAGFAGLACAHELDAAGYDVSVLEARNRVGGRVLTLKEMVPGKFVEAGGEFIGANHATFLAYAAKFGLTVQAIPLEADLALPLMLDGRVLSQDEARRVFEEMDKALAKLNESAGRVNANQPWKSPGAAALDAWTMAQWLAGVEASLPTKHAIRAELEGDKGVSLERQSHLAFLAAVKGGGVERYWTQRRAFRCAQGNQALAEALASQLTGFRLHVGKQVTGITHGDSGIRVTTKGNEQYVADDVVVALPPNLWKDIHFTPHLPAELDVQMGMAVKHLSAVKKRFWTEAKKSASSLGDGDVSMTWDGTAGSAGGGAELTCYSGGPAAERIRSRSQADREAAYRGYLEKVFPGYSENVTGEARFMDWPSQPFTMAGNSYAGPGQVTKAGPILETGIDRLHFAGEYACFKFCGTMEGALSSGVSAARWIAKRDGVV